MSHRKERFTSTLKQCLADILVMEMNNPLFKFVFISNVVVSENLKKAKVFVSSTPAPEQDDSIDVKPGPGPDEMVSQLTKAKGSIKRALGQRMYIKYIPELVFIKADIIKIPAEQEMELDR